MDRGKGKTRRTRAKVTSTAPIPTQKRTAPLTQVTVPAKPVVPEIVAVKGYVWKTTMGFFGKPAWEGTIESDVILRQLGPDPRMKDIVEHGNAFLDLHKELKLSEAWIRTKKGRV